MTNNHQGPERVSEENRDQYLRRLGLDNSLDMTFKFLNECACPKCGGEERSYGGDCTSCGADIHLHVTAKLMSENEELREALDESEKVYEHLCSLLEKRFQANPDGSLPDYKVEDVLIDNDNLRAENEVLRRENKDEQATS